MKKRVLVLQEKEENKSHIRSALFDCELVVVESIDKAVLRLREEHFRMIISAVHLERDGSVFDFLKYAKASPSSNNVPFVFYCAESSTFARSVRDGLQIAARALGADKYISMEVFNRDKLREEFAEFLPPSKQPTHY